MVKYKILDNFNKLEICSHFESLLFELQKEVKATTL